MHPWATTVLVLVAITIVIQAITCLWLMTSVHSVSDFTRLEARTRDVATLLAFGGFSAYTFVVGFFFRYNLWRFVDALPFDPVYRFARAWLSVPAGRQADLGWIYAWIWTILAFTVPCAVFAMINAGLSGHVFEYERNRRARSNIA